MPRKPKNVHSQITRHGRRVYYYRAGRGARVRLPDTIGSPEFSAALKMSRERDALALLSRPVPIGRPSFKKTQRQKVGAVLESALRGARQRAKKRGVPFDIDLDWALGTVELQGFKCQLSSIPFYMDCTASSKIHPFTPSFDRIEPAKGYVRSNVRIVVYAINVMLFDWGPEVFERVVSGYRHTKGTKNRILFPRNGGR